MAEIETSVSPADFSAARTLLGRIMGEIYLTGLYLLFEQFPALKPANFP